MQFVVIGAGPTGLGAAWRLKELGLDDFVVLEQNGQVGGLAASYMDAEGFTWDFGVHVAHSHYAYVDRLMERILPDGFLTHERRSWVYTQNTFVPYPFQYNFRHLPEAARQECLNGLRHLHRGGGRVTNFREWILGSCGAGIARHFMIPYNQKIWTVPPEQMSCAWLGDRVPQIDLTRVQRNLVEQRDDVSWGPNHVFHFPRAGGTGAIWNAMQRHLGPGRIRLNTRVVAVDPAGRTLRLASGEMLRYDRLISTMPLNLLGPMTGRPGLAAATGRLRHSQVQVVGVALPFPLPVHLRDKTWIYCPDDHTVYYRLTPFSLFSPAHTPDPGRYCSFLCEVATPDSAAMHPEADLAARILTDLRQSGLLDFNPAAARTVHFKSTHGYPIPTLDRDAVLAQVLPDLEACDIYSRGRFGAWKYEVGNMDHSLMQGVECIDRILNQGPEPTLTDPARVNAGRA